MNKELELEAEKYARRFEENEQSGYNGESISIEDRMEMDAFIAGATSKWVEKQKLEFAIEQLKSVNYQPDSKFFWITDIGKKIKELEQQLEQL